MSVIAGTLLGGTHPSPHLVECYVNASSNDTFLYLLFFCNVCTRDENVERHLSEVFYILFVFKDRYYEKANECCDVMYVSDTCVVMTSLGGETIFSCLIIVLSVTTIIIFWKMFNCCDELFSYAKSQWPCRCKMTYVCVYAIFVLIS